MPSRKDTTPPIMPTFLYSKVESGSLVSGGRKNKFIKYKVVDEATGASITVKQWAEQLAANNDDSTATQLTRLLALSVPFSAYFWETPAVPDLAAAQVQPMEFVVVDAPQLDGFARHADQTAFAEHFLRSDGDNKKQQAAAVVFDSRGKDAQLVAPKPTTGSAKVDAYSHLAAFVRGAPSEQVQAVWRLVAQQYLQQLLLSMTTAKQQRKQHAVWLSTSGMGVAWLHFRLDSRPKYYTYGPYTQTQSVDAPLIQLPARE